MSGPRAPHPLRHEPQRTPLKFEEPIKAVYAFADESGAAGVYWLTQEYNAPTRSLYDTLAHRTSFVVYQR
jgi:hypothetical protein